MVFVIQKESLFCLLIVTILTFAFKIAQKAQKRFPLNDKSIYGIAVKRGPSVFFIFLGKKRIYLLAPLFFIFKIKGSKYLYQYAEPFMH